MAAMSREDKYRLILKTGIGRSGISNEGSMIMDDCYISIVRLVVGSLSAYMKPTLFVAAAYIHS